jgi:spore coat protein U-like protein
MKTQHLRRITAVATALAALSASTVGPVMASTATSNFDVTIQVMATCSISASDMAFGSITTGTTSNTDATSSLTVNCSSGTPYTIALGNGNHYSGGRRMKSGDANINYFLYSDSARSSQWNSTLVKTGTGSGGDQSLEVFGRIPAGQSVPFVGAYSDTVIATVTY